MESRKHLEGLLVALGAGMGIFLASAAGCSSANTPGVSKRDAAVSGLGGSTGVGGQGAGGNGSGGTAGSGGGAGGTKALDASVSSGGSGGSGAGGAKADASGTGGGQGGAGGGAGNGGGTGTGGGAGSGGTATDAGTGDGKPRDAGPGGAAGGGAGSGGGIGTGGSTGIDAGADPNRPIYAYGATVENTGIDCQVPTLPEGSKLTTKISKLPDPFPKIDGTKLSKRSEWRCRRQEILEQAKKYVFGDRPAFDVVSGSVTSSKISVHVEALGKKIDFTAKVVLPTKGTAPYPAIINVGASGMTMTESRVLNEGVAVIYFDNYKLGVEGTPEQSRGKPNPGLFYDIYGGTHSAGLLMAWSWGASRMIDVLQQSGGSIIDYQRLGVTGCSRLGKGAFAIGLFDERIALTMPQEPSTGGDPAFRIQDVVSGAERTDYNYKGLNWLSDYFAPFVYNGGSNAVKLPIDTHSMIATFAPRGLLVLENPHQTQMGAPAGHMATITGAEVYKALGVETNVSYHSSVADTNHCSWKTEYNDLLIRNITRFLKHETAKTGDILVGSGGSLKTADWKDWTTPTLADDLPANWVLR